MNLTTVSKFLALILRHKPEELGLTLDEQGWCNVDELVKAFKTKFNGFTFEINSWIGDMSISSSE